MDATDSEQAQEFFIIASFEGERQTPSWGIEPVTLALQARFGAALASSGCSGLIFLASGALVKWPRGRMAEGP